MRKMMYSRPALRAETNTWAFTAHAATATLQDAVRGLHREALGYLEQLNTSRQSDLRTRTKNPHLPCRRQVD